MNAYEALARSRKVARIVAIIPPGALTPAGARNAIELLEEATPKARADFARLAGVTPPSDETWRLVVETVRARMLPANSNAGKDPASFITEGRSGR